ncbi:SDR family NAD(P)-dependent oxidoreductase [Kineosporia sp. J2-2]|uniref:SDR family NAD(P)-dependent oxidoreductase n=1 Tax=Kineosporia corallincola TaxID=2835133 RepID=A0ABS5TRI9_9ACTN|nr:SDR family NAD(P)-dependent oxidoreductase [Kineosporia corallincola]MBT0773414.1 SDR family NAD(P)-dependent oxidoreductase [Kineosporia corallincola]
MDASPVVLITGASGGIGTAVALAYAGRGARLVLTARSAGLLDELVDACAREGGTAVAMLVDVAEAGQVRAAVDRAVGEFGRLDVVVHTAAVVAYGRLSQVPVDVWDRVVDVGVRGTANVAREALRVFEPARAGSLVIVGSVLGQITAPRMGSYATSKWAVHGLARTLQQEARQTPGVHVALVSPGGIDTRIYRLAATYVGRAGSPPPPVLPPGAVARTVLKVVDRRRRTAAVGPLNPLMRLGFSVTPRLYDVLVGPLFNRLALARRPSPAGEGNVFGPRRRSWRRSPARSRARSATPGHGERHQELTAPGVHPRRHRHRRGEPGEPVLQPVGGGPGVGLVGAAGHDLAAALAEQPLGDGDQRGGLDDHRAGRPRHHRRHRALLRVAGPVRQPFRPGVVGAHLGPGLVGAGVDAGTAVVVHRGVRIDRFVTHPATPAVLVPDVLKLAHDRTP